MEITKEDYFDVKYNEYKDVLEIKTGKKKNIFARHKFATGVISVTGILVVVNLVLVYKFFEILCTM